MAAVYLGHNAFQNNKLKSNNFMKIFLILLLAITCIAQTTKADTIDYWHVYYNKIRIAKFNNRNTHDVVIKIEKIKSKDSITVKYYMDAACYDCDTYLCIKDEKHQTVIGCHGKGVETPISFALKDLLAYKKKTGCNSFEVFYPVDENFYPATPTETADLPKPIFRIKFE